MVSLSWRAADFLCWCSIIVLCLSSDSGWRTVETLLDFRPLQTCWIRLLDWTYRTSRSFPPDRIWPENMGTNKEVRPNKSLHRDVNVRPQTQGIMGTIYLLWLWCVTFGCYNLLNMSFQKYIAMFHQICEPKRSRLVSSDQNINVVIMSCLFNLIRFIFFTLLCDSPPY